MAARATTIKFGDYLNVTDEGSGVIRVDGCPPCGCSTITIAAGQTITFLDSDGNPVFRIDEDGDLHGLTGKALTFDL